MLVYLMRHPTHLEITRELRVSAINNVSLRRCVLLEEAQQSVRSVIEWLLITEAGCGFGPAGECSRHGTNEVRPTPSGMRDIDALRTRINALLDPRDTFMSDIGKMEGGERKYRADDQKYLL